MAESLPFRYLAVDGPIGAGKTTLVERLAARFDSTKILEDIENPFLGDFYRDVAGAAFQTELYFLLSRFKQQRDLVQPELFSRLLLSDYAFQKNRIFAYLNLTDDELLIFDKLFLMLEPQVPKPDLVLFLTADLDTCLSRIRKRRMKEEKTIAEGYVAELIDAYNHYYYHYNASPLLVMDTRHLDFAHSERDFDELVLQLQRPIRGTHYYVPMGANR